VDNFKQAFMAYLNKAKEFLLKKDENSKIKYKNLSVCAAGLLVFILICLMLVPSKKDTNTMVLHPDDVTTANEEVSFDDNKAVAVSPSMDDEALQIQNKSQEEIDNSPENIAENEPPMGVPENTPDNVLENETTDETATENLADESSDATEQIKTPAASASGAHFLYCGKYKDKNKASEYKANLALQAGFISTVVNKNNIYTLKLGPFNSRDEAVSAFNKMDSLSLVDECQLETE